MAEQWDPSAMTWPWPDPRSEQIRELKAENQRLREQLDAQQAAEGVRSTDTLRGQVDGELRRDMARSLLAGLELTGARHGGYYVQLAHQYGMKVAEIAEVLKVPARVVNQMLEEV